MKTAQEYLKDLGFGESGPELLLVEDNDFIAQRYLVSLTLAGFGVSRIKDGSGLLEILRNHRFDVILSDTDMPESFGPEECEKALNLGLVADTLLLGMSDDEENQRYWGGIAHVGGFFDKNIYRMEENDIGMAVLSHYWNFRKSGDAWKGRMLKTDRHYSELSEQLSLFRII